jgi:hypothetical protein
MPTKVVMTPEELQDLEFARTLVRMGVAREVREVAGRSRPEMVAAAGGVFSVAALQSWETGPRHRPHGQRGAAYGRALREVMVVDVSR